MCQIPTSRLDNLGTHTVVGHFARGVDARRRFRAESVAISTVYGERGVGQFVERFVGQWSAPVFGSVGSLLFRQQANSP